MTETVSEPRNSFTPEVAPAAVRSDIPVLEHSQQVKESSQGSTGAFNREKGNTALPIRLYQVCYPLTS